MFLTTALSSRLTADLPDRVSLKPTLSPPTDYSTKSKCKLKQNKIRKPSATSQWHQSSFFIETAARRHWCFPEPEGLRRVGLVSSVRFSSTGGDNQRQTWTGQRLCRTPPVRGDAGKQGRIGGVEDKKGGLRSLVSLFNFEKKKKTRLSADYQGSRDTAFKSA